MDTLEVQRIKALIREGEVRRLLILFLAESQEQIPSIPPTNFHLHL